MSTSAAIVVGVLSGIVTGLISTLLTIRHEREAEFRTRQLSAAEDYLRTSLDALRSLAEARGALENRSRDDAQLDDLFQELARHREALLREILPLQLLFGRKSRTFKACVDADNAFDVLLDRFKKWRSGEKIGDLNVTTTGWYVLLAPHVEAWSGALDTFSLAARSDVPQGMFARTWSRVTA